VGDVGEDRRAGGGEENVEGEGGATPFPSKERFKKFKKKIQKGRERERERESEEGAGTRERENERVRGRDFVRV
jgi:hypothetical protein